MAASLLALTLRDLLSSFTSIYSPVYRVENDKIKTNKQKNPFKQTFDIKVKVKVSEEIKYIHI